MNCGSSTLSMRDWQDLKRELLLTLTKICLIICSFRESGSVQEKGSEGIKLTAIASEIITTAAFVIVLFVVLFYQ